MEEIWKDIEETGGFYQVSNLGRVRSMDRNIAYSDGTIRHHKGRIIKPSDNQFGYPQVHYPTIDGKQKTTMVHRLVARYFVEGYADGLIINHKDEDKHNNRADNLEWVTSQYNNTYGTMIDRRTTKYKENSYTKRGKKIAVYKEDKLVGVFNGYKEAGDALGYRLEYISLIANGKRHPKHIRVEILQPRSYMIGQYKDDVLVATYTSLERAAQSISRDRHIIMAAINSGKLCHGFIWRKIS